MKCKHFPVFSLVSMVSLRQMPHQVSHFQFYALLAAATSVTASLGINRVHSAYTRTVHPLQFRLQTPHM